jgi:ribonuclease Z
VPHTVEIYYPASGQIYYEHLRNSSIFYNVAKLQEHPISRAGKIFANDKFTIETQPLEHTVEAWGYRIQERDGYTMLPNKLAAAGVKGVSIQELKSQGQITSEGRIIYLKEVSTSRPGQSFAFIMDTCLCPAAFELAQGADLLVCESTYLSDKAQSAEKHGHLTATQAATIAKEAGAKKLVLTHFSQIYPSTELFVKEASAIHPNVVAVEDGDQVALPKRQRVLQ